MPLENTANDSGTNGAMAAAANGNGTVGSGGGGFAGRASGSGNGTLGHVGGSIGGQGAVGKAGRTADDGERAQGASELPEGTATEAQDRALHGYEVELGHFSGQYEAARAEVRWGLERAYVIYTGFVFLALQHKPESMLFGAALMVVTLIFYHVTDAFCLSRSNYTGHCLRMRDQCREKIRQLSCIDRLFDPKRGSGNPGSEDAQIKLVGRALTVALLLYEAHASGILGATYHLFFRK